MVKMKICPKCKSVNIHKESTRGMFAITGMNPIYTCEGCGHSGIVFPDVDNEDYEELK
ncbi:MAG: hypothetical protein AABW92_03585 [Nanoarchaeota archaeon]|mgnify:CR=1 FL=1